MTPRPRRAEGASLRRDRDTRQTPRFSSFKKGGEFEGYPLDGVVGREPYSRSELRFPATAGEMAMASIHKEILLAAQPEDVWAAIRDVGAVHRRLAPGFVVDCRLDVGGGARVVTFANGLVVRELIVDHR